MADKVCSVAGCERNIQARRLCSMHYSRQRIHGEIGPVDEFRRSHRDAVCSVIGCGQKRRKREWCASHYSQWKRLGEVKPFSRKWADPSPCLVCQSPPGYGHRQFCSGACYFLWRTYEGAVPTSITCRQCGIDVPLTRRGENGKRKLNTSLLQCDDCRRSFKKHGCSPEQLRKRDGADCQLCRSEVDMTLRHPNPLCPSVDHVLPRARGGTNDPENLQLAHLVCNLRKGTRVLI